LYLKLKYKVILFEICKRFAKYPNPNTLKIEKPNPDLKLWVFGVHMPVPLFSLKSKGKVQSSPGIRKIANLS
jgi:hypothetical protein